MVVGVLDLCNMTSSQAEPFTWRCRDEAENVEFDLEVRFLNKSSSSCVFCVDLMLLYFCFESGINLSVYLSFIMSRESIILCRPTFIIFWFKMFSTPSEGLQVTSFVHEWNPTKARKRPSLVLQECLYKGV